jgi:RimJ/RimL family protein N-acetyltransferase
VPWSEDDLPLLIRLNAAEMTEHLGGPETDEQVLRRHQRSVAAAGSGIFSDSEAAYRAFIFKAILEPDAVDVGSVNFWDREWNGEHVYEMGWAVVPEFQGRGIASAMVAQAVELARSTNRREAVHSFPSVDNPPSNAVCHKAGFTLFGEVRFEYPKGHWMQCNDWRVGLRE